MPYVFFIAFFICNFKLFSILDRHSDGVYVVYVLFGYTDNHHALVRNACNKSFKFELTERFSDRCSAYAEFC